MTLFSGGSSLTQKEHLVPGEKMFLARDARVHDLFALEHLFFKFIYFSFGSTGSSAHGLSLVTASRGYSLVVAGGLLLAVASLVESQVCTHLTCAGFASCGSWALKHRLSSCGAWAWFSFPNQESNPCLLHWQADS